MVQRRHWDLTISNSVVLIVFPINNILKLSYFPLNIHCIVELPLTATAIHETTLGKMMATMLVSAGGPCQYSLLQWPQAPPLHKGQEPIYYSLTSLMAISLPWPLSSVPKATSFPLSLFLLPRARKEVDAEKEVVSKVSV